LQINEGRLALSSRKRLVLLNVAAVALLAGGLVACGDTNDGDETAREAP
jgi:hypothetical protein